MAVLHHAVRLACLPYLPDLHTPEEVLWFFANRVLPGSEVWLAESAQIDGFCAYREGWVDHLYIRPECHGQGLGSALLRRAMTAYSPLRLWVFQRNTQAIEFYLARGFRQIATTDGAGNEEREPSRTRCSNGHASKASATGSARSRRNSSSSRIGIP